MLTVNPISYNFFLSVVQLVMLVRGMEVSRRLRSYAFTSRWWILIKGRNSI